MKPRYSIPDYDNEINDFSFKLGSQTYRQRPDDFYPVYSYKYLNINIIEKYCFIQTNFEKEEYNKYFEIVRDLSYSKIGELHQQGKYRFRISKHNRTILDLLTQLVGKSSLTDEQIPEFGHFHLSETNKIDEQKSKCPVIHFFLGERGVFHILFYDPYHQIHPTKH